LTGRTTLSHAPNLIDVFFELFPWAVDNVARPVVVGRIQASL